MRYEYTLGPESPSVIYGAGLRLADDSHKAIFVNCPRNITRNNICPPIVNKNSIYRIFPIDPNCVEMEIYGDDYD